jgi:hypothetical protein
MRRCEACGKRKRKATLRLCGECLCWWACIKQGMKTGTLTGSGPMLRKALKRRDEVGS